MAVEVVDPGCSERRLQLWVKLWRERLKAGRAGVLEGFPDEPSLAAGARQQSRPGLDLAGHRGHLAHAFP